MRLKIFFFGLFLFFTNLILAQIPFPHNANSAGNGKAERVSRFGVNGISGEFFEITNATVNNSRFLPALWAHSSLDNGHVMQLHSTTLRSLDSGNQPLIKFIASVTPGLVLNAPNGAQFPWGNGGTQQTLNTRPTFSWLNGNNTVMLLSAQNNLGIGTTSPSARLHTKGTVRFQNLPNATSASFMLGTDASGNVREYPVPSGGGGGSDVDWLKTTGGAATSINNNIYTNGRVGIGTTNPIYSLQAQGDIYANGGWLRVSGNRGLFFQSYGGGFYMTDATWIRTYNNKSFYHNTGIMRTDGTFQVGPSGNRFTVKTNGRVGIGTTSPTAKLHNNGSVRFQNLPNGFGSPRYILGTDSNGNVREYLGNSGGVSLQCLLPFPQSQTNRLTKVLSNGNLTCSQVYDNGINVGIGTTSPTYKLSVNGPVHSTANIFISDKKFKRNITQIENPLETILNLNGKTYNWRVDEFKDLDFTSRKQIGFIAQEVKKIIPEIVYVDDTGEHSMNYTALIPLLVEAIKEQQNQITLLENKISDIKKVSNTDEGLTLGDRTSFSTNYPNPFSSTTTVDYYIMKNVKNAKFIIYDSNGSTINTYSLNERSRKSQLVISKDGLNSGIYFYTLIADNIVIGTKKMIVK